MIPEEREQVSQSWSTREKEYFAKPLPIPPIRKKPLPQPPKKSSSQSPIFTSSGEVVQNRTVEVPRQVNIPHAFITGWTAGSYGNCPGVSHQKRPLPIYVRIDFDQNVTEEFATKFFQFLTKSLNPSRRVKNINVPRSRQGDFSITIQPSVTKEHLQDLIDKANRHFDPEFKTPQELAAIEAEAKLQKEIATRLAAENALKKQLEEERLKIEAEKRAEEERRIIAAKEFAKDEEERKAIAAKERAKEEAQLKAEQARLAVEHAAFIVAIEKTGWKQVSAEEQEIEIIMRDIAQIKEFFTANNASKSSALSLSIFEYLKKIGTSASFKVLKMLAENGDIPQHFLNRA